MKTNTRSNLVSERNFNSSFNLPTVPLSASRATLGETERVEWRARRFATENLPSWSGLKQKVAAQLTEEFAGQLAPEVVRLSVNEADALAALTPFPALFLPALAEEKVRAASAWQVRQEKLWSRHLAFAE